MVIEASNPAARAHAARAIEAATSAGWQQRAGWEARIVADVVCHGGIETEQDARAALTAALAGAGIVAIASASREIVDGFIDDLRRLGPVDHVTADLEPAPSLLPEHRALLALLAEGLTLGEAAAELGLPRRTADRRLAAARAILGVERTAEALAKARRLGWLRRDRPDGR